MDSHGHEYYCNASFEKALHLTGWVDISEAVPLDCGRDTGDTGLGRYPSPAVVTQMV